VTDVVVPETQWDDDSEGVIAAWFYASGDAVAAGAVICELMNEKVSSEIEAPCAGVLTILCEAEAPVRKGMVIARVS
jgi:pyruvate/2-oxoglutarate dehydrogenase complex dihydrolipoamide acyltransferase (E2) component